MLTRHARIRFAALQLVRDWAEHFPADTMTETEARDTLVSAYDAPADTTVAEALDSVTAAQIFLTAY